jgi:hypothetical protein
MRRIFVLTTSIVTVALTMLLGLTAATAEAEPYCGIQWGSLPKADHIYTHTTAPITNMRGGQHACFDRLVIDLGAQQPGFPPVSQYGYQLAYGPPVDDNSGQPLPLAGGAFLKIAINAPAHDFNGNPTYTPADRMRAVNVTGYQTFRQVAFLSTFEGVTSIVIGVRSRLPFQAFFLAGPGTGSRFVIDVAHLW